jgi:hypothetical protein
MARNYSNIVTAIWKDPDFRALPGSAQRTYMMFFSQQDISAAGVLAVTLSRWARYAADTTVESITADIDTLAAKKYVVVDADTDELLVRSFARWDKGYRNPKRRPVLLEAIAQVQSPVLRVAIRAELARLETTPPVDDEDTKPQANTLFDDLSDDLSDSRFQKTGLSNGAYPIPLTPNHIPDSLRSSGTSAIAADAAPRSKQTELQRTDVEQICTHLADRIEANGSLRPTVTARWRTAARLLLDKDKRSVDQVTTCIDWCQSDEFWRTNILSMPTLRERYDQLRLAAMHRRSTSRPAGPRPSTTDQAVAQTLALAAQLGDNDEQPQRRAVAG